MGGIFRVRGIDYRGEEVLSAQSIRWENVAPALPEEVGKVPLGEVVELDLWNMWSTSKVFARSKGSGVHKTASCNGGSRALGDPVH